MKTDTINTERVIFTATFNHGGSIFKEGKCVGRIAPCHFVEDEQFRLVLRQGVLIKQVRETRFSTAWKDVKNFGLAADFYFKPDWEDCPPNPIEDWAEPIHCLIGYISTSRDTQSPSKRVILTERELHESQNFGRYIATCYAPNKEAAEKKFEAMGL